MTTSMIVSYTPWAPRIDVEAAGRILDQIEVPEGQVPLVIAFGDDAGPMLYVHFRPLSRTQLREYGTWARQAGFHQAITSYHPSRKAFQVAAKARWPRAVRPSRCG